MTNLEEENNENITTPSNISNEEITTPSNNSNEEQRHIENNENDNEESVVVNNPSINEITINLQNLRVNNNTSCRPRIIPLGDNNENQEHYPYGDERDEEFERLLDLCKRNIMKLYHERTNNPELLGATQ